MNVALLMVVAWSLMPSAVADSGVEHDTELVRRLQYSEWSTLDIQNTMKLIGGDARKVIEERTDETDECRARYFVCSLTPRARLRFEIGSAATCTRTLQALTYRADFDSRGDAETHRLALISELRASGLPFIDENVFEYVWRSTSSTTRYHMWIGVSAVDRSYRVGMRLTHEPVKPSDVESLPFERGYMGCPPQQSDSQRSH